MKVDEIFSSNDTSQKLALFNVISNSYEKESLAQKNVPEAANNNVHNFNSNSSVNNNNNNNIGKSNSIYFDIPKNLNQSGNEIGADECTRENLQSESPKTL